MIQGTTRHKTGFFLVYSLRRPRVVQDQQGQGPSERSARRSHEVKGSRRGSRQGYHPHLPGLALRMQPELAGKLGHFRIASLAWEA